MIKLNVFLYEDYLVFLHDILKLNKTNRGLHTQLARAAGMHPSYFSRILHSSTHLTPDQAAGLCSEWGYDRDESQYFLGLVNLARAGTSHLKKIIKDELQFIRDKHDQLSERLPARKIDLEKENIYYSAWYYSAVHILVTIPGFSSESAMVEKIGLPKEEIRKVLETLEQLGLVRREKNKWMATDSNIHLSNHSWMSAIHHINWRIKMADQIQMRREEDLHYTGVHTLSRKDFKKIKELLKASLVDIDKVARPSKEEELCCLAVDLWRFGS